MKLVLHQQREINETEVEVRYAEMDENVRSLIRRIRQSEQHIIGEDNGRRYRVPIESIYYIESMERNVFIYTKAEVFRSELRIYQFLNLLDGYDFVQIGKGIIVNMNMIDCLNSLANSRLQITLINGERLNVSRRFLAAMKSSFIGKGDIQA